MHRSEGELEKQLLQLTSDKKNGEPANANCKQFLISAVVAPGVHQQLLANQQLLCLTLVRPPRVHAHTVSETIRNQPYNRY